MKKILRNATGLCALLLSGCSALPSHKEASFLHKSSVTAVSDEYENGNCHVPSDPVSPSLPSDEEDCDSPGYFNSFRNLHIGGSVSGVYSSALLRPYGLATEGDNSLITKAEARFDTNNTFARAWARNSYNVEFNENHETDFGTEAGIKTSLLGCSNLFAGGEYWTLASCNNHTPFVYGGVENSNCLFNSRFVIGTNPELGGTLFYSSIDGKHALGKEGLLSCLKAGPYVDFAIGSKFHDGVDEKTGMIYVTPGIEASLESCRGSINFKAGYQFGGQPDTPDVTTPDLFYFTTGAVLKF